MTFDAGRQIANRSSRGQDSFPELFCAMRSLVVAEDDHTAPACCLVANAKRRLFDPQSGSAIFRGAKE
ncbi:MAG: hypothetical protein E5V93_26325, partial [Mesorhizobium sp.]